MKESASQKVKLSPAEVRRVADLARIELRDGEEKKFAEDLSAVLSYIDQLNEIDTENIPATNQVTGLVNILRDDVIEGCDEETKKKILEGAPMREGDYIKVKAVL
jgi:aspartyl-tRNA(Asn)/glutamyl-tRNA(Gln) amidotransferase subunit C